MLAARLREPMSMWSRKRTDLIVPIRDRRRGRRILTTRNVLGAAVVAILAFTAITIRSQLRKPTGDYGRLFGQQVSATPAVATAPASIVMEGPASSVSDQTAADPMLLSGSARDQYLGVHPQEPAATPAAAPSAPGFVPVPAPANPAPQSAAGSPEHVTIVGGADGVKLVRKPADHPVLGGGIFKP